MTPGEVAATFRASARISIMSQVRRMLTRYALSKGYDSLFELLLELLHRGGTTFCGKPEEEIWRYANGYYDWYTAVQDTVNLTWTESRVGAPNVFEVTEDTCFKQKGGETMGTLKKNGMLMVVDHSHEGHVFSGLLKWFLADNSACLFRSSRKEEPRFEVGTVCYWSKHLDILYFPPIYEEQTQELRNFHGATIAFKKWLASSSFYHMYFSKFEKDTPIYLVKSLQVTLSAFTAPEFATSATVQRFLTNEERVAGRVCDFAEVLKNSWSLWEQTHSHSASLERDAHELIVLSNRRKRFKFDDTKSRSVEGLVCHYIMKKWTLVLHYLRKAQLPNDVLQKIFCLAVPLCKARQYLIRN